MKTVTVRGGTPLVGRTYISGSKNAALPMLFATMITGDVSRIRALPNIGDVRVAIDILRSLGADVRFNGDECLIDTARLSYTEPSEEQTRAIRASTYLIGACLSRFGVCRLTGFGGCGFAARPIDMHVDACLALGARLEGDTLFCDGLRGGEIRLRLPSVGATVNSLMLAVSAVGESRIYGYAREPHVRALIDFLRSAGADITETDEYICVSPRPLHGADITVVGDMIEAGTYLAAGLITDGRVEVRGCPVGHMDAFFDFLGYLGANVSVHGDSAFAEYKKTPRRAFVKAEPYPGFPTDLQPISAVLMAKARGGSIRDTVFPTRFGYLAPLRSFGVRSEIVSDGCEITPSVLRASEASSPDLRGGAALLLAALGAPGESRIHSAELILRGYENLDIKLRSLGADININSDL